MKTKQLFWGFYFLSLGTMFLLAQFFSIEIAEGIIWNSWPVILIILGILVMVRGHVIKTIFTILLSLLLAIFSFGILQDFFGIGEKTEWEDIDEISSNTEYYEYNSNYKFADLNFSAGWGKVEVNSSTNYLWKVVYSDSIPEVISNTKANGKKISSEISFQKENWNMLDKGEKNFEIALNENPVWNLTFDLGAVNADLDLEDFKVKNLKLNNGASKIKIKIGEKYPIVHVEVNAGASNVTLFVPQEAGCKVTTSGFLLKQNLLDFSNVGSNTFVSPNFQNSATKIFVNLKSAAMNFEVKYY